MSFLTAAYLMQTYGPLLTEHELSEVLKLEPGTVRNKRAKPGSPPATNASYVCFSIAS